MRGDLDQLKQQIPLLEYLQRHNWTARRVGAREEFAGLCPLHPDTRPSFYVNARKNLFYCHGCQRGGDLIRFVELSRHLSFRETLAHLRQHVAPAADSGVLERTAAFYQVQLHRHPQVAAYLRQRCLYDPDLIEELGLGYAPGGNLRRHLAAQGYSCDLLLEMGLLNNQGRDAFCRRVIFPCRRAPSDYQPPRTQYWQRVSAPFTAALQGWFVCLGVGQHILERDPRRRLYLIDSSEKSVGEFRLGQFAK